MLLTKKDIVYYLKYVYHLLTIRMWLPIITALVLTIILVGNIIYEVSTAEKFNSIEELEIEYTTYDTALEDIANVENFVEVIDPLKVYDFENTGYIEVNTQLNVREEPNTDSEILTTLTWMNKVNYSIINDDWAIILLDDNNVGDIASKYITDTEKSYSKTYDISGDKAKTFMDYRTITDRTSRQYSLQLRASTNEENGLRMLRGRYMVAVGSYFGCSVGQFIDVVLSDG